MPIGDCMDLKKALEIQVEFFGKDGTIRVDENGYICLNDLNTYFPNKRIEDWQRNESTKDFIGIVEKFLIHEVSRELERAIIGKKGRYKSGTYAHKWVALHFAMWLSPEFNLKVIRAYEDGTQYKQDWNIKRILSAQGYRLMSEAVKGAHDPAKHYHFSNEARMLNSIAFGEHSSFDRDAATEDELDALAWLESHNAALIDIGMSYEDRKVKLHEAFQAKYSSIHNRLKEVTA